METGFVNFNHLVLLPPHESRTGWSQPNPSPFSSLMVSVVIPTYNRSAFLRDAIDSVLCQQEAAFELIVVDDGSSDDTEKIVESYGTAVRYVRQSNSGVSAARNKGLAMACGEWLAFLDSDDFWLPGKLRLQLDYLAATPALKVCQTEELWVRNGERLNPRKYHAKPSGYCFPQLLERCLVSPSAVMIHRDVFADVGFFDEELPACEDYDLWLRIGCKYPIGLLRQQLIVKRGGHPDQLSSSIPMLDKYRIAALMKILQSGSLSPTQKSLVVQTIEKKCRIYGAGCLRRGRIQEGQRVLSLPARAAMWQNAPP